MIINVSRSAEPVTIPANNKSMFFVRGDGLSKEFGVDETLAYCKRRFEKWTRCVTTVSNTTIYRNAVR